MRREVVQDFLTLPGIAGVALMDGRSRPYFYGVDQALNFQQKEALAQGIQQVVETTPTGFEFFEFQFVGYQVYIYKLDHGIILLVLTGAELVYASFAQAIEQLKAELKQDAANAIATFRLLAGNTTLSNQNYWKRRAETTTSTRIQSTPIASEPADNRFSPNGAHKNSAPEPASQLPEQPIAETKAELPKNDRSASTPVRATMKEILAALNHFSQFTTQYLGNTVVTNYWKTTRPAVEWLNQFQVDRAAQISFSGSSPNLADPLTPEQHQWVRDWTAAFIQRCSKVIRDFPAIIDQRALDESQKSLLLIDKS